MAVFEREFFLEFWKTLRCLWFCGTNTYHKVLAHPSHPLVVRVDTFRVRLHTASSWLVAAGTFSKGVCSCFNMCVIKQICTSRKGFCLQEVRSGFP